MSEARSQRSGAGSDRQTATTFIGASSRATGMSMRRMATRVIAASPTVSARPRWTPPITPYAAMARPPSVGATAIGIRLRIDWTVNPTARRSLGSASPTTANSVGLAMLDHAITTTTPVAVADPAARVLIDAVEKILARAEEPDGGDRCPERFEILRQEALPEVLAEREEEDGPGDRDDVALETEGLRSGSHVGLDTTMKLLFHTQS